MDQVLTVDVVPHIPMLKRYAMKLARNPPDADDLVQDCLLRALARAHQFEPGTNLPAWLMTILRNLFINRYQRGRRIVEVELEPEIAEVSMDAPQVHSVALQDAAMAIQDLKPDQRRLIEKCGVEGVSYEDAAAELGVSVGTIRSRLSRARSQLRDQVTGRIRPAYLRTATVNDRAGAMRHQAPVHAPVHQAPVHQAPERPDREEQDAETSISVGVEPERIVETGKDRMIAPPGGAGAPAMPTGGAQPFAGPDAPFPGKHRNSWSVLRSAMPWCGIQSRHAHRNVAPPGSPSGAPPPRQEFLLARMRDSEVVVERGGSRGGGPPSPVTPPR
ncbi:sigma-70 family RNA polymerase sigma factor [Skermanella rosea]|uniref:sigma-70 family RNA polymerase sigma factor n=1 Tax=Skermanella rosea TaxID=1817965 RepID=UPI001931D753|nr:sigma-70 family RNA polymerase sigma factor [Skermanella rosea]UEM01837.1 sigma-70 family RNA polymerase sigma factor [Skermanella rosea]